MLQRRTVTVLSPLLRRFIPTTTTAATFPLFSRHTFTAQSAPMATTAAPEKKVRTGPAPLELHEELEAALTKYRSDRAFDPTSWIADKTAKLNKYMSDCRLSGAIVSLSGGVDSAVTLGLLKAAQAAADSPVKRVVAVAQPIHSSGWAAARAKEAADDLKAEFITVDQTALHDALRATVDKAIGIEGGTFATGQLRSYQRTPVAFYLAQLLTQGGTPAVVVGTGNKDEDGYLLYFCKAGDGVADIQLIADLHKSEVFAVGAALGVPKSILTAPPSADLWNGQTDEEELGVTYSFVELYTGSYLSKTDEEKAAFTAGLSDAARTQFTEWAATVDAVHRRNKHKENFPLNL